MTEEEEEAAIPISFFVSSLLFFFPLRCRKTPSRKDTTQHIRYCTTTIEMQGQGEDEVIITMKHSQVWVPLDLQTMYLSKSNVQDADTWMRWKLAKDQQG
ncbi:hypothetical protein NDA17_003235 [Ustilago hordei]|nr:hypothetical protein NDA17_003235 [Ustilago hordei]